VTVLIYDNARRALGTAQLDWSSQQMAAAIPVLNYQPILELHTYVTIAQPFRSPVVSLNGQAVHSAGWWQADTISFPEAPIGSPMNCVVIYRQTDGMLVLAVTFPTITATKSVPVALLSSAGAIGLCRP